MLSKLVNANISIQLNQLNIESTSQVIHEAEFKNYFLDTCGKEHYRLLAYISLQLNNSNLLDIGTYKGCSALALSINKSNTVHTFDISDHRTIGHIGPNVHIYHDYILNPKYRDLILSCPFMILDTFHDGIFELQFLNYLREINYQGYLLLDDIYYNDAMKKLWSEIKEEKYDLSSIGHHSGTGLVVFKNVCRSYLKESYVTFQPNPFGFWEGHANRYILDAYSSYIKGHVFDFGCNHAASTYWLKENPKVSSITGFDLNEEALTLARQLFSTMTLPSSFCCRNLTDGTLLDTNADTIISLHTLEHIYPQDIPNFLNCAYQALKSGGYFIISIPYDHAYLDPCHVGFYTEQSLIQIMSAAGFKTIECFKDDRFNEKNLLTGLFQKIN